MLKNYVRVFGFFWVVLVFFSCAKDDDQYVPIAEPEETSPVVFDIENVPYPTLSEYNFFEGNIADLSPVYGVLPYDVIAPLFSDYAHKKRFVWMPKDSQAHYIDDYSIIEFPLGTILIKNFYYDEVLPEASKKLIETRLQIKKEEGWIFANYVWNDLQTEATFDLTGSLKAFQFLENGIQKNINYRIPPYAECLTCHKSENDTPYPIGVKPQNLDRNYTYQDGSTKNQLEKWVEFGYLSPDFPDTIDHMVSWSDDTEDLETRVRSYLDINCAHCHSDLGHCNYRELRFAFHETEDLTNLGLCVEAQDIYDPSASNIINPGSPENSLLLVRLNTTEESLRMPLLGRTLKHDEGIELLQTWISSLNINCE
ncbi:hypothetical protein [Mangrovimonas sp. TPBH4]|uniref:hypothetical protein n=1 Tax=Mangrovimonas sp. TPBH4 TaxID=1645914 RepID=UPI0006B59F74|nr:hypothetical protein [Mangrovimonas sp. TPBH4]